MAYEEELADRVRARLDGEPHASAPMMCTRQMKGFVVVAPEGVETEDQPAAWVARGSEVARSLPPK